MWVIIVTRVVKKNTMATAQYSPRTANVESKYVLGPFLGLKAAQAALVAVTATHTCLGARVFSESQIRGQAEKRGYNRDDDQRVLDAAVECLDATK